MLGYAISVYLNKDVGDKIIKIAEALEKLDERKVKNSELFKRGANVYSEAVQIFIENRDKFSDLDDFDKWLIEVINDLRNKVKEVSPADFVKMRGKQ
jgi:septation ring formation regulator EzrA